MKFEELNLKSQITNAIKALGLENPTEVQEKAIPLILQEKDVIVRSKTGSGKTFAFAIPILQKLTSEKTVQALILAPTRELAQQTDKEIHKLDNKVKTALIYGGVGIIPQIDALESGAQIVVATPGRLLD